MMIAQVLLEGLILGILLMGICAVGIRKGAVGNVASLSSGCKKIAVWNWD